jgi:hypothetical protein
LDRLAFLLDGVARKIGTILSCPKGTP